jgi:hypothetical protein
MGTTHEVIIRLTENWKKLPDLNGFDFENMVVPDIQFDSWKNTISFQFIEHDDESYFVACVSRFIQAWQKRDGNIWKVDKVFWGGLEDYVYPEDWNSSLHDIFPHKVDESNNEKELISEREFLSDNFFPVRNKIII